MIEFFQHLIDIISLVPVTLSKATKALNDYNFDESLLTDYLGYLRYAMGSPLYILFSSISLIGIGAMLWQMVVKTVSWIMQIVKIL